MLMVYLIVLVRYRNLIPLMWALMVVEVFFRLGVGEMHPLTPDYYMRTPPGKIGNLPILVVSLTMVVVAVRNTLRNATVRRVPRRALSPESGPALLLTLGLAELGMRRRGEC